MLILKRILAIKHRFGLIGQMYLYTLGGPFQPRFSMLQKEVYALMLGARLKETFELLLLGFAF
jgi:hypothetical protein